MTEMKEELQTMGMSERLEVANFLSELLKKEDKRVDVLDDASFEGSAAKVFERHGELLEKLAQ